MKWLDYLFKIRMENEKELELTDFNYDDFKIDDLIQSLNQTKKNISNDLSEGSKQDDSIKRPEKTDIKTSETTQTTGGLNNEPETTENELSERPDLMDELKIEPEIAENKTAETPEIADEFKYQIETADNEISGKPDSMDELTMEPGISGNETAEAPKILDEFKYDLEVMPGQENKQDTGSPVEEDFKVDDDITQLKDKIAEQVNEENTGSNAVSIIEEKNDQKTSENKEPDNLWSNPAEGLTKLCNVKKKRSGKGRKNNKK